MTFLADRKYAVTGPNGSGKSTFLLMMAGSIQPTEGKVICTDNEGTVIAEEESCRLTTMATPYLELIEEMTAQEMIGFHARFKRMTASPENILTSIDLSQATHKQIRYFSSGMKQRLKLGLAFFSESPLLILDEPFTNLDESGISIFRSLINRVTEGRIVFIGSNDKNEYEGCSDILDISSFK